MYRFLLLSCLFLVFTSTAFSQNAPIQIVRIEVKAPTNHTDETVIYTDSTATLGFDGFLDAEKISNGLPAPTFASLIDDSLRAAINAIPPIAIQTTIPLSLVVGTNGTYLFTATQLSNFPVGADVVLDDSLLNVSQSLLVDSTYSFTFNTTDTFRRFYLNFLPATTSINNQPMPEDINFIVSDNTIKFKTAADWGKLKDVSLYDMAGRKTTLSHQLNGDYCTMRYPENMASGIYLVNIQTIDREFSEKIFIP